MAYDPNRHHRQSIRLSGYDYSQPGTYFLTLCIHNRDCIFGDVVAGEMRRNDIGEIVVEEWLKSAKMRSELRLDHWIVMPNHLHGIVSISRPITLENERAHDRVPLQSAPGANRPPPRKAQSISSFVAGFKSAVTSRVNRQRNTPQAPVWQSNFFEHVVRSNRALEAIREYIFTNPQRWDSDRENPSGDGTDDVEAFVTSLDASAAGRGDASPVRETRAHGRVPLQGGNARTPRGTGCTGTRPCAPYETQ